MASLMELIERVNKGELVDPAQLEIYQESSNSAEKFLAHHAHAMLDLRRAQQHMMQSLEAIDYSDQKVLNQFISVSGFLGLSVLANTKSPELAFEWLRYLVSPEVQAQQLTQLPIWTSLQNSAAFQKANPAMSVFLTNLANARPRPQLTHYVEASAVLQHHLHDLVIGATQPGQALHDAQTELLALWTRWHS